MEIYRLNERDVPYWDDLTGTQRRAFELDLRDVLAERFADFLANWAEIEGVTLDHDAA